MHMVSSTNAILNVMLVDSNTHYQIQTADDVNFLFLRS